MSEKISDAEKIELLSEDVQEILGQIPNWIIRWGVTVIFLTLIMILIGSTILKYPDVISSTVTIVSENPPVPIMAQVSGKIESLFVKNQEIVKPGSYLAILENTTNYKNILDLKDKLKIIHEKFIHNDFLDLPELSYDYSLGSIQGILSNFQLQYNDYKNYIAINIIGKKVIALNKQIFDYKGYTDKLNVQAENLHESLMMQHKQFKRDSLLFSTGEMVLNDFEKSAQSYLQAKNNYQGLLASIFNTNIQVNQLQFQVDDLQSQLLDQTGTKVNSLKQALDNLLSAITEWEKKYVLMSPIEGKINFLNFWSPNQYVVSGSQVFTVIPIKSQRLLGKLKFLVAGSGKVEKGQKVLIRIDKFPYTEFGMLEGKIESISLIPEITPQGSFYNAEVNLNKGLTTNYGKVLPFNQEMSGTAEIITKNLSVFDRMVTPLKSAMKKSS